jgi:hypothetical protein
VGRLVVHGPAALFFRTHLGGIVVINLFERNPKIDETNLHPKFKMLRDEPLLHAERGVINGWTDGFVDRDNKIVEEFQKTYHSAIWELYLFNVFKEAGYNVDFSKNRPDFILTNPHKMIVEAVVSEIKEGGRSEKTRGHDDFMRAAAPMFNSKNFHEIIDEATVRHSNSLLAKSRKYQNEYTKCDWVNESTPFVVALGSYDQIDYGREYLHSMLQLLYGLREETKTNSMRVVASIKKPGTNSDIPVGLFRGGDFSHISAVIFSCTMTLGKITSTAISQGAQSFNTVLNIKHDFDPPHYKLHLVSQENPEELSDGLFIFSNPFAANPLPAEAFKSTNAIFITLTEDGYSAFGESLPIVARINAPFSMVAGLIADIDKQYNS